MLAPIAAEAQLRAMSVPVDAPLPEPADARESARRAVWDRHHAGLLAKVGVIDHAIAVLSTAELDEQLRGEAQRCAHMLSGSLGIFGFTQASEAAHELELEFAQPAQVRAPTLSTLVVIVRRALDAEHLAQGRARVLAAEKRRG
jgi:HPt (histidine-containing phosphotransfer) domain-containing protein